jgi:hypothetical protein
MRTWNEISGVDGFASRKPESIKDPSLSLVWRKWQEGIKWNGERNEIREGKNGTL